MLKKLNLYLRKKLKDLNLTEIADVMLFGSAAKGKEFPMDIDLCIIFKKEISKEIINNIENKLKEFNVHISSLVVDNFFKKPHSLVKTLFVEGISVLHKAQPFIKNFGFSSYVLYSYDLSKLNPSEKVKFVYLLKGRKEEIGIIKKMNGEWIADSCFIIPIQKDSEMLIILKKWAINFKRKEALIH
ncbi:MAG TPA: nucleotidyltransferase domain-containing protein [Candidatus Nanoarchaeia archaeon]|nr:nucleotidyltransferase domain-containing protein [Candidatus Nanoarchaeia archaeon]